MATSFNSRKMFRLFAYLTILLTGIFWSCSEREHADPYAIIEYPATDILMEVPQWAQEAIWYQIFVERFRDGDPSNQPQLSGIEGSWPHDKPDSWQPTRWTQDWYAMEDWALDSGKPFYLTVQMRRYGGDLQGVLEKLDYLEDLGITAIYFNPLNDSPSLHKYDARNYHHIDIYFGPDPEGDLKLMAGEDPVDPSTWVWTSADRLFLKVVEEAKKRGIRVIMDYSWNHTGITFWAWKDVLVNQSESKYADWYRVDSFKDEHAGTEFSYTGWAGVFELPEFRRHGEGAELPIDHSRPAPADLHPDLKRHIFAVTRRWLDPTGTGDLSKGVDGFRLDVAELVPGKFWQDYRAFVRSINPEAYLVGELWWEKWPDKLMNPDPWLQGDMFDANMNYRWYMPSRSYFGKALPLVSRPSDYVSQLESIVKGIRPEVARAEMNLLSSHDAPRFMTSMQNRGRYKYQVNPRENPGYNIMRATSRETFERMDLLLVKLFTDIGAPHIWMGDEMGMWGADDPDTRKPLIWPDLQFDDEKADPFGRSRQAQQVKFDSTRFSVYQSLIRMRKTHPLFVYGTKEYIVIDDEKDVLGSKRVLHTEEGTVEALVLFNNDDQYHRIKLDGLSSSEPIVLYSTHKRIYTAEDTRLTVSMEPRSAIVFLYEN